MAARCAGNSIPSGELIRVNNVFGFGTVDFLISLIAGAHLNSSIAHHVDPFQIL